MALPYINLYIGDVKKDTDLLSPAAFGAYMRLLLFHMHEAKVRGQVAFTLPQLCRVFGANDLQQTKELLTEIVNPDFEIVDYQEAGGVHIIRNRRMIRETAVSLARSEAGKKGAKTTNQKNRANKNFAEESAAAKQAAGEPASSLTFAAANDVTKRGQKYNTNINNNGKQEEGVEGEEGSSGAPAEKEVPALVVPKMLQAFRTVKPRYIYRQESDFPALRKIAEAIATQEQVDITTPEGIEKVLLVWEPLVQFMQTDKLFKDFQISQVEKYFQSITSKYISTEGGKKSESETKLQSNISSANEAKLFIQTKHKK